MRSEPVRPTVLLVEDDLIQGVALEMLLNDAGLKVDHVPNATAAEDWLRHTERQPDLILSDYRLRSDISGLELIRRLRDMADKSVPAILLTGDLDDDVARAATAEGCRILHKPYCPGLLLDMTQTLLSAAA